MNKRQHAQVTILGRHNSLTYPRYQKSLFGAIPPKTLCACSAIMPNQFVSCLHDSPTFPFARFANPTRGSRTPPPNACSMPTHTCKLHLDHLALILMHNNIFNLSAVRTTYGTPAPTKLLEQSTHGPWKPEKKLIYLTRSRVSLHG